MGYLPNSEEVRFRTSTCTAAHGSECSFQVDGVAPQSQAGYDQHSRHGSGNTWQRCRRPAGQRRAGRHRSQRMGAASRWGAQCTSTAAEAVISQGCRGCRARSGLAALVKVRVQQLGVGGARCLRPATSSRVSLRGQRRQGAAGAATMLRCHPLSSQREAACGRQAQECWLLFPGRRAGTSCSPPVRGPRPAGRQA